MSWQCKMIEYIKESSGATLNVGDMFYYNPPADIDWETDEIGWYWLRHFAGDDRLSEYYKLNNLHRPPLLVFLPGRCLFCVDAMCWHMEGDKIVRQGGWNVTGDAPCITVAPSILIHGVYHGFLQNGVISDDCEGKQYGVDGRPCET